MLLENALPNPALAAVSALSTRIGVHTNRFGSLPDVWRHYGRFGNDFAAVDR